MTLSDAHKSRPGQMLHFLCMRILELLFLLCWPTVACFLPGRPVPASSAAAAKVALLLSFLPVRLSYAVRLGLLACPLVPEFLASGLALQTAWVLPCTSNFEVTWKARACSWVVSGSAVG